jgi:hypothetical protein
MAARFGVNFVLGLHLVSAWGGAGIGGYESYAQHNPRYFSEPKDDLHTASARGLIRGVYYPYKTITHIPKVWVGEKPPWV